MNKLFWFILFTGTLFGQVPEAQRLIDLYRNGEETALTERLELNLLSTAYWMSVMRDENLSLGWFETDTDLLVCDKEDKKVRLYRYRDGDLEHRLDSEAVIGKMPGDKQFEGDLKTPEGVYRLTEKKAKVDPFYGPFAYVTSYPNLYDKAYEKNGSGIWLHGFPPNCDDKNATKGCVALNNEALKELDGVMDYKQTVMIIAKKGMSAVNRDRFAELMVFLYQWRSDWKANRFASYIDSYSEHFRRFDGMGISRFAVMKNRIFSKGQQKQIVLTRFRVVPFESRQGKKVWYVSFHEDYKAPGYSFEGMKTLYIEDNNGRFEIVAEQ